MVHFLSITPLPLPMRLLIPLILIFPCFWLSYCTPHNYTSIFNFGDSLSDTGNFLITGARAFPMVGLPPYGMTYFGQPTGRCSDGRLIVDFIAEALGLPFLPPYLAKGKSFEQGANFAVAGATATDPSFFVEKGLGSVLWTNYSLSTQVEWFEDLKPSLCHTSTDCRDYFNRSLFLVGEIGGNDYNFPLLMGNKSIDEVNTYAAKVIEAIATATKRLINLGAIHLIIPGNLPIGCNPAYLTAFRSQNKEDYDSRTGCLNRLNDLARHYNALLSEAVQDIQSTFPQAAISYADYYGSAIQFANSPASYGFTQGDLLACCGAGGGPYNFALPAICGLPGTSTCSDPSTYVNWDGIHLTEAAYHHIARSLLKDLMAIPSS